MQLIDQLVSLAGVSATAQGQPSKAAQAEQAALFQQDLELLEEGEVPPPARLDLSTQDQPPESNETEVAIAPFPTESVAAAEPTFNSNSVAQPTPQQSKDLPQDAVAATDVPLSDSLENEPPAQLVTPPNAAVTRPALLPQSAQILSGSGPRKDVPQEPANLSQTAAKPKGEAVQTPTSPGVQNALVQAEAPRISDAQGPPSRQDRTIHNGAAGREKGTAAQTNLMPARNAHQVAPAPLPTPTAVQPVAPIVTQMAGQPSVQPDTYVAQAVIMQPISSPPLGAAAANDLRAPVPPDIPMRQAPAHLTAAAPTGRSGVSNEVQMTQAPLVMQPITGKDLVEAEPLVALSPLQSSGPLSPAAPANVPNATPAQTSYAVHQITAQIAAEAGAASGRDIEVRLDPEELGRVRITVHPREAGLLIALAVERPETLDLLRKNADELMSNLQDFDLSGATLEFSQDSDGPPADTKQDSPKEEPIHFSATPQATGARPPSDGRLDLRL
jgi:hypothetical protein